MPLISTMTRYMKVKSSHFSQCNTYLQCVAFTLSSRQIPLHRKKIVYNRGRKTYSGILVLDINL